MMKMSEKSIGEYAEKLRERYQRMTGRKARSVLIEELIAMTGWSRKHANKVLLGKKRKRGTKGKRGAPKSYPTELIEQLKACWFAMDQPCGKRMKDMMSLWVEHLSCSEEERAKLIKMSAASMDRFLKKSKVTAGKKIIPPKPASAVKSKVEVRAENWETSEVGWTEIDTVAHCGGNMGGDFIWTLTSVEIASGWTEVRAVWNRGQHATFVALEGIWESQPFDLLGVDSDNGGEFLNYHLYEWLKKHGIKQTRSRPYYKNDQAYVEQKNYTHVRQLIGYERLEHIELLDKLNQLLKLKCLWRNLYCVTMKQQSKHREGSRQIRKHEKISLTPAQRLLESSDVQEESKNKIRKWLKNYSPFEMAKEIKDLENQFWTYRKELYEKEQEEESSDN